MSPDAKPAHAAQPAREGVSSVCPGWMIGRAQWLVVMLRLADVMAVTTSRGLCNDMEAQVGNGCDAYARMG